MRLLISAGGTGGGVFPALAVGRQLTADAGLRISEPAIHDPQSDVLWVGSHDGMEADLVARAGLPFKAIHGGGLHGVGWRLPLNALHLARGFFEALGLVGEFRPSVVLVTGGFIAAPVALAAWLRRVPILLYVPDIEPGLAARLVGRLARKIAVTAEESHGYFGERDARKVVVTGYPTRPELGVVAREDAIRRLGLDPQRQTILVTGGSRGARSLNRAVFAALTNWLKDYQVIHLSGQLDWAEAERAQDALPGALRAHYHAYPFLHEMGLALAAADVAVSRAGASALGEYPLFGLPAILVPYPHAWRYQKVNADYLAARGAAVRLDDERLPVRLGAEVRALLEDKPRLARMREAARAAATPNAARRMAQELVGLAASARRGARP
jgi:UDP-N-acetylglucosamine--N-acetylmuramyl-(pentapeptide) pyrophosphoryl-undecaprenol N-acetylglucosamine transferase